MTRAWRIGLAIVAIAVIVVAVEWSMGRLPLGPDGHFGWLETDIWSGEQSQRLLEPYSASHLIHGLLFYGFLRLVAPRRSLGARLVAAITLEAGWEILENSPLIIDRYRAVTIAQGYTGDSILNSLSDVAMAATGFVLAWRCPVKASIGIGLTLEILMLAFYRDNLTLNILMLAVPIEAIRTWQMEGKTH